MEVLHPQEALRSRKAELPVQEGDSPAHVDDAPDAELAVGEEEEQPADEDVASIMHLLPESHDRIKGLYKRYKDPTDTPHQRQLLALALLRELNVHMLAEEAVVYPVLAEQIGEEHLRDHAVDEHDSLKLFASDLEGMKAGDEGYDAKLHQLMETYLDHAAFVEHRMLPALRDALHESELRELGQRFEAAKQHMPTRPHPGDKFDDATVLLDAARDAAAFEGQPPAIGSDSTEVLREAA